MCILCGKSCFGYKYNIVDYIKMVCVIFYSIMNCFFGIYIFKRCNRNNATLENGSLSCCKHRRCVDVAVKKELPKCFRNSTKYIEQRQCFAVKVFHDYEDNDHFQEKRCFWNLLLIPISPICWIGNDHTTYNLAYLTIIMLFIDIIAHVFCV